MLSSIWLILLTIFLPFKPLSYFFILRDNGCLFWWWSPASFPVLLVLCNYLLSLFTCLVLLPVWVFCMLQFSPPFFPSSSFAYSSVAFECWIVPVQGISNSGWIATGRSKIHLTLLFAVKSRGWKQPPFVLAKTKVGKPCQNSGCVWK